MALWNNPQLPSISSKLHPQQIPQSTTTTRLAGLFFNIAWWTAMGGCYKANCCTPSQKTQCMVYIYLTNLPFLRDPFLPENGGCTKYLTKVIGSTILWQGDEKSLGHKHDPNVGFHTPLIQENHLSISLHFGTDRESQPFHLHDAMIASSWDSLLGCPCYLVTMWVNGYIIPLSRL